jgi:hypothetical protein
MWLLFLLGDKCNDPAKSPFLRNFKGNGHQDDQPALVEEGSWRKLTHITVPNCFLLELQTWNVYLW